MVIALNPPVNAEIPFNVLPTAQFVAELVNARKPSANAQLKHSVPTVTLSVAPMVPALKISQLASQLLKELNARMVK